MKNKRMGSYWQLFFFVTAPVWVIFIIALIAIVRGCS